MSKSPKDRISVATMRPQSARYTASTLAFTLASISDDKNFMRLCRFRHSPFDSLMKVVTEPGAAATGSFHSTFVVHPVATASGSVSNGGRHYEIHVAGLSG